MTGLKLVDVLGAGLEWLDGLGVKDVGCMYVALVGTESMYILTKRSLLRKKVRFAPWAVPDLDFAILLLFIQNTTPAPHGSLIPSGGYMLFSALQMLDLLLRIRQTTGLLRLDISSLSHSPMRSCPRSHWL